MQALAELDAASPGSQDVSDMRREIMASVSSSAAARTGPLHAVTGGRTSAPPARAAPAANLTPVFTRPTSGAGAASSEAREQAVRISIAVVDGSGDDEGEELGALSGSEAKQAPWNQGLACDTPAAAGANTADSAPTASAGSPVPRQSESSAAVRSAAPPVAQVASDVDAVAQAASQRAQRAQSNAGAAAAAASAAQAALADAKRRAAVGFSAALATAQGAGLDIAQASYDDAVLQLEVAGTAQLDQGEVDLAARPLNCTAELAAARKGATMSAIERLGG